MKNIIIYKKFIPSYHCFLLSTEAVVHWLPLQNVCNNQSVIISNHKNVIRLQKNSSRGHARMLSVDVCLFSTKTVNLVSDWNPQTTVSRLISFISLVPIFDFFVGETKQTKNIVFNFHSEWKFAFTRNANQISKSNLLNSNCGRRRAHIFQGFINMLNIEQLFQIVPPQSVFFEAFIMQRPSTYKLASAPPQTKKACLALKRTWKFIVNFFPTLKFREPTYLKNVSFCNREKLEKSKRAILTRDNLKNFSLFAAFIFLFRSFLTNKLFITFYHSFGNCNIFCQ